MANPQIQSDPIYSLPHLYVSGLTVSVPVLVGGGATSTLLAIAPGQARDMNDNIDMPVGFPNLQGNTFPAPLFINSAVNGVNGLDQGTLAASSIYLVWLIGDSRGYNQVAGLVSLASNAQPLLPLGYDSMRLLASVQTTAGSVFNVDTVLSYADAIVHYLQPNISVLAGGNATTFTAINMSTAIPNTAENGIALLTVNFTPAAAGDTAQFRWTGSTATTGLVTVTGVSAGVPQQNLIQVVYDVVGGNAEIDYKVSSASDSLSVLVNGYILPM
jgi:hypothetical protein